MGEPWPLVSLGSILRLRLDVIEVDTSETYPIAGVYSFGRGLFAREPLPGHATTYKVFHRLREGDLVLSQLKAWEGALALVPPEFEGWHLSPQFPTFRVDPNRLLPAYLGWYFKQASTWDALRASARGMGARRDSVSPARFLDRSIPLPPIEEQRRVVGRIEAIAAKVEEAQRLRREAANESKEVAFRFLARAFSELSDVHGLQRLDGLIVEAGYGSSVRCEALRMPGDTPVLRIPNVASERVSLTDMKYGPLTETERKRLVLVDGDILVVRTNGSLDLVGRSAVVPSLHEPTAFASYLIRLRLDRSRISPNYAQRMLQVLRVRGDLVGMAQTTAGQFNVSLGRLRAAAFPVPSLDVQMALVAGADALDEGVRSLGVVQERAGAELDALLPSVLDRAFRGEL